MYKSALCQSVVGALWQRSLTQTLEQRVIRVAGSALVVVHLLLSLTLRRRGIMGDSVPDVFQSTTSSLFLMQVGTLPHFLEQW